MKKSIKLSKTDSEQLLSHAALSVRVVERAAIDAMEVILTEQGMIDFTAVDRIQGVVEFMYAYLRRIDKLDKEKTI